MNSTKVLLALIALALFAAPASALVGPDVRVTSASIDDLNPGGQANLTLTLENVGVFKCAYKVTTQLQVAYPLSVQGFDSQFPGTICSPNNATLSFQIKADANAPVGAYAITLVTTYESEFRAEYSAYNTVYAYVKGAPEITAHVTKTTPITVYPGDDFSIEITVDNTGAFRADSLLLQLAAESPLEVRPSTETQSAATLQARASTTKTFYLHVPKAAAARTYSLSLDASYINEDGERTSRTIPLSVSISSKPVFEASDGTSTALIDSRNNEIRFKLKNTGTDAAKRVRAKLLPSFPFSSQGSVQYVEQLAPGQEQELVFYVDVDKEGVPGQYALDLSVSYENTGGDKFTDTIPVTARAGFAPPLTEVFAKYWYAWLVVLAAIVFMLVRRRKPAN